MSALAMISAIWRTGNGSKKRTLPFNPNSLGQRHQAVLHIAIAVNVQFGLGYPGADLGHGADGDIQSLVPLQAAGKQNDLLAVVPRPRARLKDPRVYVVDKDGTFAVDTGPRCVLVVPQMVGDDHVVGVPRPTAAPSISAGRTTVVSSCLPNLLP